MSYSWEKQNYETQRQYSVFCVYRDLGFMRSLKQVFEKLHRKPCYLRTLEEYSSKNHWVERAGDYDIYIEAENRRINEQEIREMKKRHIQQALLMQKNVIARIQDVDPKTMTLSESVKMLDVAVKIERLSRDCNDQKIEVNTNVYTEEAKRQLRLDKLSTEELEEYEKILQKMNENDEQ